MQTLQNRKLNITALGVGGHGTSIIDHCIIDPRYQDATVNVIMGVDDDGGDTGAKKQMTDELLTDPEDRLGMQQLFPNFAGLPQAVLPVGDLRSNMRRWLELSYANADSDVREVVLRFFENDNRVSNPAEIADQIAELCQTLQVDMASFPRLADYLSCYSAYFAARPHLHSVANTFLLYLFLEYGTQDRFFEKLREMQLLPANFRLYFLNDARLTLCAMDILGDNVVGESTIDNHDHIIIPSSYHLLDHTGQVFRAEHFSPKLKEVLQSSDLIVAVTGSIANLVPALKLITIENRLGEYYQMGQDTAAVEITAPTIWVGNSFAGKNEAPLHTLIDYFMNRIPNLIALLPEGSPILSASIVDGQNHYEDRLLFAQRAYEEQGKTAANSTTLDKVIASLSDSSRNLLLRILATELHEIGRLGIKYDTYEVMSWIWFIYNTYSYLTEHHQELSQEQIYAILGVYLQRFLEQTQSTDAELQRQTRLEHIFEVEQLVEQVEELVQLR